MPFWRCYYHLIWATKNRAAWITPKVEATLLDVWSDKSQVLESPILAMNTVANHVHIAATIPPKIAIAEWVKQMKGVATRDINAAFPNLETAFSWQGSYGVVTFGSKNLDFVVAYIQRQKEHHSKNTLVHYLEQIDET